MTHTEHSDIAADGSPYADLPLRTLIANSPDAVTITDDDGRFLEVNDAACDLFGFSKKQILRMRVADLLTPDGEGATEQFQSYLRTGRETGEFHFVRGDKRRGSAHYSACRLAADCHISILRDSTPSGPSPGEISSSREYRLLFDTNPQPMWIFDVQTFHFLAVNDAAVQQYGYSREEFLDMTIRDIRPPDDIPLLEAQLAALPTPLSDTSVWRHVRKDGTVIHVQLARQFTEFEGRRAVFVLVNDVTQTRQHLSETETLNRRLARTITETHHRVKNNLQIISALVELQVDADQETVPASALTRIGQHARALAAIHDLLTAEAKAEMTTDSVSTRAAMDRLIPLLQLAVGSRNVRHVVDDFRVPVRDSAALALLVSELVSNAVKHGRGPIDVELRSLGDSAFLAVSDDGPGFPPDFDWREAANTGLGLIESTGRYDLRGAIAYENRPEGGARVVVSFPI